MPRSLLWIGLFVLSVIPATAAEPIELDTRRELFVDHHLLEKLDGLSLDLQVSQRANVALTLDRPWEGAFCGYFTVIHDGPLYRLYYRGMPGIEGLEVTCYAESSDGRAFTRPNLGLFEICGTRENNVILAEGPATHNFSPFLDTRPGVSAQERYKALGGDAKGLLAFASADGVHWRPMSETPVITEGKFDSQNVGFWSESEQGYLCYFRTYDGYRTVSRVKSQDFLHWSQPEAMTYGETPREHLYTNQTHPYFRAPHIYLSFPMRFVPGRKTLTDDEANSLGVIKGYREDATEGVFLTSRGGTRYDRTFMQGFFRPGLDPGNWVSRTNMATLNVVPTGDGEMSIYYSQHYAQPSHYLVRTTLRTDGFASLHAPYAGGEALTRVFTFTGSRLLMNYATGASGGIRVGLVDPDGKPLDGFGLDDCPEFYGDRIDAPVSWKGGTDLSKWVGKPVRLHIAMRDADLYSFSFAPADASSQ